MRAIRILGESFNDGDMVRAKFKGTGGCMGRLKFDYARGWAVVNPTEEKYCLTHFSLTPALIDEIARIERLDSTKYDRD